MADVKWIKMKVGMFDGMSFKKIKKAKIGGESYRDKLTAIWFELMDFAGRCNQDGAFISPREIPFTSLSDIATMIDRETEELELCMSFYQNEGMIVVTDDIYSIANWSEYQNTDRLAELREYNRLAKRRSRENQKLLTSSDVNDKSMTSQSCQDTDIDIDTELDTEKRKKNKKKDNIELFLSLRDEYSFNEWMVRKILEWLEYKNERKDYYVERGMKTLLTQIQSNITAYGEDAIIQVIDDSMSNGYKGIIFDKLTKAKPQPKQSSYQEQVNNRMSVVDNW